MNEEIERIEPRIEPVELRRPELPKPELPRVAVLPPSIALAQMQRKEQITKQELANLRRWYKEGAFNADEIRLLIDNGIIEEPKNIFQLIQEQGMKSLLAVALSFVKNNWRTTVAGLSVFAATTLAKAGINLSQHEIDALMGIGYAIIFKFSDVRWDLPTIVGIVLMVLSFFVNPVLAGLGITLDAGILLFVQQLLQQGVATLLKDQKQIFQPQTVPAQ